MQGDALIDVQDMKTYFYTDEGVGRAVDGVSFSIAKGEVLGIVGESGCGKSVTSLSIMRLVPSPPGRTVGGKILFEGQDLLVKSEAEMRKIRGNQIAMIFQEPMTSLNPVFTVGNQLTEAILLHMKISKREARDRAVEMLEKVGIPGALQRIDDYPHEFSGGMRQRAMIAMALSCDPAMIIADEPTTALDVTIQAQILELMNQLREELGTTIMLITHSLPVVAETCHRVVVMYAGRVVETASVCELFEIPHHPYTVGLMGSLPRLGVKVDKLSTIEGVVPSPFQFPKGCRFKNRCSECWEKCEEPPPLYDIGDGHLVRCWLYENGPEPTRPGGLKEFGKRMSERLVVPEDHPEPSQDATADAADAEEEVAVEAAAEAVADAAEDGKKEEE
jgi:peptide/nickel transport system ATP-binding protein/oligopeptide transport system ATP-binding protein